MIKSKITNLDYIYCLKIFKAQFGEGATLIGKKNYFSFTRKQKGIKIYTLYQIQTFNTDTKLIFTNGRKFPIT